MYKNVMSNFVPDAVTHYSLIVIDSNNSIHIYFIYSNSDFGNSSPQRLVGQLF